MKTDATMLRRTDAVACDTAPDGTYSGLWSGCHVGFSVGGVWYECQTRDGVRGIRIPCVVTIAGGRITVSA
jgi:hypothetical protein